MIRYWLHTCTAALVLAGAPSFAHGQRPMQAGVPLPASSPRFARVTSPLPEPTFADRTESDRNFGHAVGAWGAGFLGGVLVAAAADASHVLDNDPLWGGILYGAGSAAGVSVFMIATESEPAWLATAAGGLVGALPLAFTLAREDALGDVAFSLSVLGWLVVPPVTAWVANWLAPSRSTPESERN